VHLPAAECSLRGRTTFPVRPRQFHRSTAAENHSVTSSKQPCKAPREPLFVRCHSRLFLPELSAVTAQTSATNSTRTSAAEAAEVCITTSGHCTLSFLSSWIMSGTTRKHASGSGLPCPAHRLQKSRPLPAVTSAASYSEHTPPHTAFETPDGQSQAPGTSPAAAAVPALVMHFTNRVSWHRGRYSPNLLAVCLPARAA
jgi:hypothetical protein